MSKTLYFYDLETSGFNPKEARIMQFAGQRTDLELKPIGDPQNILIKLSEDVLPDPSAILVTGITPQKTLSEGISEPEFLKQFHRNIVSPETIFVGYNSVRFDDEFLRYLHYRNFYDPYEWQWRDGRAKWDLLDVIRMMRALRPEGLKWPIKDGKPTNQLGLLTKINKIPHIGAHDALADVKALIELAKLVNKNQPKLFKFLLDLMTNKDNISKFLNENNPLVYTSGKYPGEFEKTTIVAKLIDHPKRQGALVYDLRFDPSRYENLAVEEIVELWHPLDKDAPRLPIKTLQFNRCPAIAPLGVMDVASQSRIKLSVDDAVNNFNKLKKIEKEFTKKVLAALDILDKTQDMKYASQTVPVDAQLYNGFFSDKDKSLMNRVRSVSPNDLNTLEFKFTDNRLEKLMPLYKARNFLLTLSSEEMEVWEKYKTDYLLGGKENSRLGRYFSQLAELANSQKLDPNQRYLIEEMKLYGESIVPSSNF